MIAEAEKSDVQGEIETEAHGDMEISLSQEFNERIMLTEGHLFKKRRKLTKSASDTGEEVCGQTGAGGAAFAVVAATCKSAISDTAKANSSNVITEENYYLLQWLDRITRVSCRRGIRIGFLQDPRFLWSIYRPMMRSKKLRRTDGDIREAVNLWCIDRAAAEERYGRISDWDVSSVTDMTELFRGHGDFNDDISRWDVSKVIKMRRIFYHAHTFNQPIGDWDVSKVTNMSEMFNRALAFNQPLRGWDVSEVTDMRRMFYHAYRFSHPVGDWVVSKVTDMSGMFQNALMFNHDLTRWGLKKGLQIQCNV